MGGEEGEEEEVSLGGVATRRGQESRAHGGKQGKQSETRECLDRVGRANAHAYRGVVEK